jgi:hypothetical protein
VPSPTAQAPPPDPPRLAAGAACPTTPGASGRCDPGLDCFETNRKNQSGVCATLVTVAAVLAPEDRSRFLGGFIGLREVTIEEYGEHCTPRISPGPKNCGSHLRINDSKGYLFLKGIAGEGYGCSYRKSGSTIESKRCYPEPGPYEVVVGKLTRFGTGWGKLEVLSHARQSETP